MGKQLERLIIILGIILIGNAVFAGPTTDIVPYDDPVIVTRERKQEKTKPAKVEKQKTIPPVKTVQKPVTKKNKVTAKTQTKPTFAGLKIYITQKPKKQTKKVAKYSCKDDPKSICNTKWAKPKEKRKFVKPKYTTTYSKKNINEGFKRWSKARPARPIPIVTCY